MKRSPVRGNRVTCGTGSGNESERPRMGVGRNVHGRLSVLMIVQIPLLSRLLSALLHSTPRPASYPATQQDERQRPPARPSARARRTLGSTYSAAAPSQHAHSHAETQSCSRLPLNQSRAGISHTHSCGWRCCARARDIERDWLHFLRCACRSAVPLQSYVCRISQPGTT